MFGLNMVVSQSQGKVLDQAQQLLAMSLNAAKHCSRVRDRKVAFYQGSILHIEEQLYCVCAAKELPESSNTNSKSTLVDKRCVCVCVYEFVLSSLPTVHPGDVREAGLVLAAGLHVVA